MPKKMPFSADRITGWYGEPRPGGRIHLGVDWRADRGTPILASGSGVVLRKRYSDLGGHVTEIRYDDGQDWNYYHSDQPSPLAPGTRVNEGTAINGVGSTGATSTGPHVHVEVYFPPSATAVDPMKVMDRNQWVGGGGAPANGGQIIVGGDPLQTQLNLRALGYYLGDLDGDPGKQTKQAIFDFQTAEGLEPDSVAGPITLGRLDQRIKELQDKLNRVGNYGLLVDGQAGTKTFDAIGDFQAKNSLTVDRIAGPITRAKLHEKLNTPTPPPVVPPVVEPGGKTEAQATPNIITPTADMYPSWIRYEEKFDAQFLAGKASWNLNAEKYYKKPYMPVESHCHWWGLPGQAGTHDGNVDFLNRTEDVGANVVTSPKRVTLTMPLDRIALTTGAFNPQAWKSENDPIMTTPEGREWGYKTLAVVHYLVEKLNPSLRNEALKLHKDYYSTRCSDIDVVYLRKVIEQFHSGELDLATGLPPVTTPPTEPPAGQLGEQIAGAYRNLGDLLEKLPEGI